MRLVGYIARMEQMRNAHKIDVETPEENKLLRRCRRRR